MECNINILLTCQHCVIKTESRRGGSRNFQFKNKNKRKCTGEVEGGWEDLFGKQKARETVSNIPLKKFDVINFQISKIEISYRW